MINEQGIIAGVYDNHSDRPKDFFERLDKCGGWPVGYKFASFYHSVSSKEREVRFGNEKLRTPFWTTRYEADDYYWWKVSGPRKVVIARKIRREFASEMKNEA
jgi:hypothetical protein